MYQYQLSFGEAVKRCFSKYCCFTGRAARSEYWWWYLFTNIIGMVSAIPYYVMVIPQIISGNADVSSWPLSIVYIVGLAFFLPSLGVTVRRLHDIGKGGGWIFVALIPVIGAIWLLVLLCQPSLQGANRFGEEPNMRAY